MRHTVCKDCADRVLHCKSWCERWAEEEAQIKAEKEKKQKEDYLNGVFVEMAIAKHKRR